MNKHRMFIMLAGLLTFLLIAALVIVANLTRDRGYVSGDFFTSTAVLATNSALAEQIATTETPVYFSTASAEIESTEEP